MHSGGAMVHVSGQLVLRAGALYLVSVSLGLAFWLGMGPSVGWLILAAHTSAILSFLWASAAVATAPACREQDDEPSGSSWRRASHTATLAALIAGTIAGVVQTVILTVRLIEVGVELGTASPWLAAGRLGFWPGGVWAFVILAATCVVGFVRTGDRRLWTCLLWCVVLALLWDAVSQPALRRLPAGTWARSSLSLEILFRLSLVMATGVLLSRWARRRHDGESPSMRVEWPGYHVSYLVLAAAMTLLVGFHLAVPLPCLRESYRLPLVATAGCGLAGSTCVWILLRRRFTVGLCDAGMALGSLSIGAVVVALVPEEPANLVQRYPLVFSATVIGMAVSTVLWAWLGAVWAKGMSTDRMALPQRLRVRAARRSSFLTACLALVVAALLAVWPRMPSIATMDHSLGQVLSGFSANLFLLLAILYAARLVRRHTFHILTGLAVVAACGYMVARVLPFASSIG